MPVRVLAPFFYALFEKGQKVIVHLIMIEFPHDSTELKQVWLCSHCSFISSDSRRKGTKEDCYPKAPSKGMQTQSRRNRRLFVCFGIAGRRDILFIGWRRERLT